MTFGLSPLQKGMYVHHLMDPASGVDVEQMIIDLPEEVDLSALERGWNAALARHQILRAGFLRRASEVDRAGDQGPVHVIDPAARIQLSFADWTGKDPERETALYLRQDRSRPFDFTRPPLMRLALAQLEPGRFRLFWTIHHILTDGRTLFVVLRDVFAHYEASKSNSALPQIPAPGYQTYIAWLESLDLEPSRQYWSAQLAGFVAPTPLPCDPCDPGELSPDAYGEEEEIALSADETAQLSGFAHSLKLSLNTLVQGAWALLLSRHSGEHDVVFGVTKTTRSSSIPGANAIAGLFLATVPLRVRCDEELSVRDFLIRIRAAWLALMPHENVALTDIRSWIGFTAASLFDSLVLFANAPFEEEPRRLGGAWAHRKIRLRRQTNYPLALFGYAGRELRLNLEFDHRRYSRAAARRYLDQLRQVLASFHQGNADQPLASIDVLGPRERELLVGVWNQTSAPQKRNCRVQDLFLAEVHAAPGKIAIRAADESITYTELNRRANLCAAALADLSIGVGSVVGISLDRGPDMVAALLGTLFSGAAYVPLDPAFPRERLSYMLTDSQAAALITSPSHAALFQDSRARILDIQSILASAAPGREVDGGGTSDCLAYILYTSGSTGLPKGVEVPQSALVNFLLSMAREPGLGPGDVLLAVTTLSFDIAGLEIFLPLITGATLVIATENEAADGRELLRLMRTHKPTLMQATPATWRMLVAAGWEPAPGLTALCGGEALPSDLAAQILQRAPLWNMYGPTETTIWSTCSRVRPDEAITIGRPIDNTTLYIVDSENRLVPIGAQGELLIGGAGVARGYHRLPDMTAQKFIPSPFGQNERLYRTGDFARYRANGEVECLGRSDHQVKIRGFRIELGEIETLLNQVPGIVQAVVAVKPDSAGTPVLVAYYTAASASAEEDLPARLRTMLRERLPAYMIPSLFVRLERLPLTQNRKIDRKALPAPSIDACRPAAPSEEVLSEQQRRMLRVWENVLGVQRARLDDNFLDLGGHSLLAVDLLIRIEEEFGMSLPLTAIMDSPTVAGLLQALATRGRPLPL